MVVVSHSGYIPCKPLQLSNTCPPSRVQFDQNLPDERPFNNVFEQLKQDDGYQEASKAGDKLSKECKNRGLTEE